MSENRFSHYKRFPSLFPIHFFFLLIGTTIRPLRFHERLGKVPVDFSRVDCFKGFSTGYKSVARDGNENAAAIKDIYAIEILIRFHQKSISRTSDISSFPLLRYYAFDNY